MRKVLIACLAVPTVLYAQTAGLGLKPGLWEVRIVKQVVDGRDLSAQMSQMGRQMQLAMEHMPPEQRARMQAMLKARGVSPAANGGYRICISPQMARRNSPILGMKGHCQAFKVTRSGNRATYSYSCASTEGTTSGTAVATITTDLVTTQTDATTQSAHGEKHTMHTESQMRYLGADCGDVKPSEPH